MPNVPPDGLELMLEFTLFTPTYLLAAMFERRVACHFPVFSSNCSTA